MEGTAHTPTRAELRVEPLGVALEPWQAVGLVAEDPRPFALTGSWLGGSRALCGGEPVEVVEGDEATGLDALDRLPAVLPGAGVPEGAVGGGWVVRLGFGLGEGLGRSGGPPPPPRPAPTPRLSLCRHEVVVRCDAAGAWWLEALVEDGREAAVAARWAELRERATALALARSPEAATAWSCGPWRPTPSWAGHERAVAACVARVAAGDLFQANVTLRLEAPFAGEAAALHAAGVRALAPAKAAFLAGPWGATASLSPEGFLRRAGREVTSSPIKGTRPRTDAGRAELLASEKDAAEHVMIVDLVRNDLGRVARPGQVRVAALAEARPGPGVWHLVSDVAAELREEVGDAELVRASFPPGSVTGAPKVAALEAIAELESTGREAYCGALGFASPVAGLDLSVAIRTFEVAGDRVWLGVGGGVVAGSTGAGEAAEARLKAAPLLALAGGGLDRRLPSDVDPAHPPLRRRAPVPTPRPDPRAGVFETLRVQRGAALHVAQHLQRLAASVAELYGRALPEGLEERLAAAAAAAPDPGRLRVDVLPDGRAATTTGPIPPAPGGPLVLEPVVVPGGVGEHKWADRRLWDALEADVGPGRVALAVDLDGLVLEAPRASLVLEGHDGVLRAPPLDGRILAGTTRARHLREARAAGRAVDDTTPVILDELRAARAAWLLGALRGPQLVRTSA